MSPLALLGLGLVLGIRHASDPDHVVAVAAITARTRRLLPATLLGAAWGLGHSLTLFLVGGAIVLFNLVVPPRVGLALEFAVALALVVVGALNLGRTHGHTHSGLEREAKLPAWRAFLVGIVHGLAGSAAVALLVLATVHDLRMALAYLATFALGTMAGMALITTGFAAPLALGVNRWPGFAPALRITTGLLSVGFGLYLAWQIGVVDGLFGAAPHWDPH